MRRSARVQAAKPQAIVVLGCPASSRLRRRIDCGIVLFQQGLAPVLVLSGGGGGSTAEAEIMHRCALARGVPESALLVEPYSRDTLGNARETARLLCSRGWQRAILVSDATHLPRATLLFRLAGVDVVGRSGVSSSSALLEIATALREALVFLPSLLRALATAREKPPFAASVWPISIVVAGARLLPSLRASVEFDRRQHQSRL